MRGPGKPAAPPGARFEWGRERARAMTPPQNRRDRMVRRVLLNGLLPHPRRLRIPGGLYPATPATRLPTLLRRRGAGEFPPLGKIAAFPPPGGTTPGQAPPPALP